MDKVNPPVVAWKARWILCPERGAIENQCIVTQGRFFAKDAIRPLGSAVDETIDLGDAIILPMPVNAHLHLDLSAFDEPIPAEGHFTDWLGRVVSHRRQSSVDPISAIKRGIEQLVEAGTRLVGDILASPGVDLDLYSGHSLGRFFARWSALKASDSRRCWKRRYHCPRRLVNAW